jgi:hypothetical protein
MSSFGVEAEVVCPCSQRRPQNLVAPLTTTGQRQVPLSGSNSDDSFHVLGYTRRRRRQFGRGFEILRATTCATTPRIGVLGARRLGSNGGACRLPSSPSRATCRSRHSRSNARLWAIRNSRARSWRVLLQLVQGDEGREGILHHILGLDHVRDFI